MSNTPGPDQDMSTLEKREEWYRTHKCYPTPNEVAHNIGRVRWLKEENMVNPFYRVLDIGCHDGFSTRWLLDTPHLTYLLGIDLCEDAITAARALARGSAFPDKADYREIGFEEIPHKPGRFDVVVAFEIIEHLEDSHARRLLRTVHDHLCDGGRAFLSTPDIEGPYGKDNPDPSHILLFDQTMLENMIFEELGLHANVRNINGTLYANWRKN